MAAPEPDYYAILGVDRRATQADIAHAYRQLLRRHHPDTRAAPDGSGAGAADASLQEVLTAYHVLRDPPRRTACDRRHRERRAPSAGDTSAATRAVRPRHVRRDEPPLRFGPPVWHPPREL